jgi:hypothetical protein
VAYIPDLHGEVERPEQVKEFLSAPRKNQIKEVIERVVDDEFDRLEEHADEFISQTAADRAKRFIERVLKGQEEAARALFGTNDNWDRFKPYGADKGEPWAFQSRDGVLFLTNGMEIRQKIVEAHADLLKNERILDLESIVEGLRKQIVDLYEKLERR